MTPNGRSDYRGPVVRPDGKIDRWPAADKTPNDYWFGGRVTRPFPKRTYEIFAEGQHANLEMAELDRQYRELPWPRVPASDRGAE